MNLLWCIAFLSPFLVWGQANITRPFAGTSLEEHVHLFSQIGSDEKRAYDISDFVEKLTEKESPKSNFKFCKTLFTRTRQEFLRRYTQYASFEETLNHGKYNCLTGTALYALLLDHFDIQYSIIETNYHIFLLASTEEGTVLFEATDPLHGFITDPVKIEQRVQHYKLNTIQETPNDGKKYYAYSASLYQHVDLTELRGLLHYNLSVAAYNRQDFRLAIHHLDEALELYNSPRISEFSAILLRAVLESKIEESKKALYVDRVRSILKKSPVMAIRSYSH